MKVLILLIAILGAGLAGWMIWQRIPDRKHDPVEYFRGWAGYDLPIRLTDRVTRQEAEAIAESGYAYLIGYFDAAGRLIRDVKMYRGEVFFEHHYEYYPSGRLKRMKVTNPDGRVTIREYRESDHPGWVW